MQTAPVSSPGPAASFGVLKATCSRMMRREDTLDGGGWGGPGEGQWRSLRWGFRGAPGTYTGYERLVRSEVT